MALPKTQTYTIDDIYNLPDGTRAELIDGQIYYMAPPSTVHQRILRKLVSKIDRYISSKRGECEVFPAPFAVSLFGEENEENHVEPDLSIICDSDKITKKGCNGAPDWIIEIVSPGSRRMDYLIKLFKYRSAGVKEYWIVDYEKNRILVYDFETENTGDYTFSDVIPVGIYEDFSIDFSQFDL